MGEKTKSKIVIKRVLIIIAVLVAYGILAMVLIKTRPEKPAAAPEVENTVPEGTLPGQLDTSSGLLLDMTEQEGNMVVTTIYGPVKFPYEFSDTLAIIPEKTDTYSTLEFHGRLEKGTYELYSFRFDQEQEGAIGTVADEEGNELFVHMEMAELPEGLTESDQDSFWAVQETVNNVIASLLGW